jgi:hypothetical protein
VVVCGGWWWFGDNWSGWYGDCGGAIRHTHTHTHNHLYIHPTYSTSHTHPLTVASAPVPPPQCAPPCPPPSPARRATGPLRPPPSSTQSCPVMGGLVVVWVYVGVCGWVGWLVGVGRRGHAHQAAGRGMGQPLNFNQALCASMRIYINKYAHNLNILRSL